MGDKKRQRCLETADKNRQAFINRLALDSIHQARFDMLVEKGLIMIESEEDRERHRKEVLDFKPIVMNQEITYD